MQIYRIPRRRIGAGLRPIVFVILGLLSLRSAALEQITVHGLFQDKAIVTIDGRQRVLKKGRQSPEGARLIEANSKRAIIEINGERREYGLGSSRIGGNFKPAAGGKKISLAPDANGGYSVMGSINGSAVPFIVDTGATLVSMNGNVARRLGIDFKLTGREGVSLTATGTSKIYIVNLSKVRVGEIELQNVQGAVHEGDFPLITLLGMSFLGELNMKREGRLLELEKKY